MIMRIVWTTSIVALLAGTAQAAYDTPKQILHSKQMLMADLGALRREEATLARDLAAMRIERSRQENEQVTYERLVEQEEDAQSRADEATTPSSRDAAMLDRDRLLSVLAKTRRWLAEHQQDDLDANVRLEQDQERITTLSQAIVRLNQVLKNDGIRFVAATPRPKASATLPSTGKT